MRFTFEKGGRESQNDILLANSTGLNSVEDFTIHRIGWNPSDHSPISVKVTLDIRGDMLGVRTSHDTLSDDARSSIVKATRIKPDMIDWSAYREIVENDYITFDEDVHNLQENPSLLNVDLVADKLGDSLYKVATTLTPQRRNMRSIERETGDHPSFKEADRLLQMFHQKKIGIDAYVTVRQETIQHLKSNVTSNESSAWSALLKENDSRALWNKINWNGKCEYVSSSSKPELAELREQFNLKGQSVENSTLLSDVTGDTFVDELDAETSAEEIVGAQKSIKEDQASSDGWTKRMITGLPGCLL